MGLTHLKLGNFDALCSRGLPGEGVEEGEGGRERERERFPFTQKLLTIVCTKGGERQLRYVHACPRGVYYVQAYQKTIKGDAETMIKLPSLSSPNTPPLSLY